MTDGERLILRALLRLLETNKCAGPLKKEIQRALQDEEIDTNREL